VRGIRDEQGPDTTPKGNTVAVTDAHTKLSDRINSKVNRLAYILDEEPGSVHTWANKRVGNGSYVSQSDMNIEQKRRKESIVEDRIAEVLR